ncbi:hypothetical protein [Parabacteroides distasonis]|jgi:hypothetical protein|uniref:hypothetical protein n=1 Tax=Parabacteroides distasonis TaxID=823 RepID=UPI00189D79FF|nr:hypothetical protein [Parabacteroides distasonis]MDB9171367.1 hypothetical protein [Parabacteroides distasonis]
MKQDEFMESIYGCLERIENKINGLSMPQSADGNSETDNSVNGVALQEITQELNTLKTGFRRVLEALVMIKGDTANLLKRNSMPDKFMETLSVLKGEQQENHKKQNEFLEQFANTEAETLRQISERMESLSASVRNRMDNPDIVSHRHSISIDTPHVFWTIIILAAYSIIVSVAFYLEKRPDYDRMDNDLKYRYIKMKGEATPNEISELENIFEPDRDNAGIERMREDVEAYEDAVRKQAALAEQARLKEQAAKELDNKARSIKDKPIQTDKPQK